MIPIPCLCVIRVVLWLPGDPGLKVFKFRWWWNSKLKFRDFGNYSWDNPSSNRLKNRIALLRSNLFSWTHALISFATSWSIKSLSPSFSSNGSSTTSKAAVFIASIAPPGNTSNCLHNVAKSSSDMLSRWTIWWKSAEWLCSNYQFIFMVEHGNYQSAKEFSC